MKRRQKGGELIVDNFLSVTFRGRSNLRYALREMRTGDPLGIYWETEFSENSKLYDFFRESHPKRAELTKFPA